MKGVLDAKAADDLIRRAVTALVGDEAAKKSSSSIEAAFELARQTAIVGSRGKLEPVFTSVRVSVHGDSKGKDVEPVTTVIARDPIGSGPERRKPIRTGGGTCFTISLPLPGGGMVKVTICVEWESPA
jgi:hypothetical protein